jgi:hypothetical protein
MQYNSCACLAGRTEMGIVLRNAGHSPTGILHPEPGLLRANAKHTSCTTSKLQLLPANNALGTHLLTRRTSSHAHSTSL